MPLVPFMSAYVARLRALTKRGQALPAGAQMHIQVGLEWGEACRLIDRGMKAAGCCCSAGEAEEFEW
jgi:hypothetical protein